MRLWGASLASRISEFRNLAPDTNPVGADDQREAAMAVYQTDRDPSLPLVVNSYKSIPCITTALPAASPG